MSTPYIGFSNETLASCPPLKAGDAIVCPHCGGAHAVEGGEGDHIILFYRCPSKGTYLAGVNGRNVMGIPSDVKGEL